MGIVALFFQPPHSGAQAGQLLLFGTGLLLLIIEFFLLPGFGLPGIVGAAAIIAGLTLSLIGGDAGWQVIVTIMSRVVVSLLLALAGSFLLLRFLPHLSFGRQLILDSGLSAQQGFASTLEMDLYQLGKAGVALTPLRPAGIAEIDGQRVDVISNGEFIDTGTSLTVTSVDGSRVVVRRTDAETERS